MLDPTTQEHPKSEGPGVAIDRREENPYSPAGGCFNFLIFWISQGTFGVDAIKPLVAEPHHPLVERDPLQLIHHFFRRRSFRPVPGRTITATRRWSNLANALFRFRGVRRARNSYMSLAQSLRPMLAQVVKIGLARLGPIRNLRVANVGPIGHAHSQIRAHC